MSAFLKLDVFRKLPKDLSEPTFCGALGKYKRQTQHVFVKMNVSFNTRLICSLSVRRLRSSFSASNYYWSAQLCEAFDVFPDLSPVIPWDWQVPHQHRHHNAQDALRYNRPRPLRPNEQPRLGLLRRVAQKPHRQRRQHLIHRVMEGKSLKQERDRWQNRERTRRGIGLPNQGLCWSCSRPR